MFKRILAAVLACSVLVLLFAVVIPQNDPTAADDQDDAFSPPILDLFFSVSSLAVALEIPHAPVESLLFDAEIVPQKTFFLIPDFPRGPPYPSV